MAKKARLAERVTVGLEDSDSNDDEDNSRKKLRKVIPQNPPVVILTDRLGIKTCQECGSTDVPIQYGIQMKRGEGNIQQKIQLYLEQGTEQPLPSFHEMSP